MISLIADEVGADSSLVKRICNLLICELMKSAINDEMSIGDWEVVKLGSNCFCIDEKYDDSDMVNALMDEYAKSGICRDDDSK